MIGLPLQAPSLCPSGRAGLFSSPGHRFSTHLYLSQSQCPKRERLKCRDGGLAIAEAPIVVSFQRLSPSPCRIGLGKDNLLPASRAIDHNDAERVCRFSAARGLVGGPSLQATPSGDTPSRLISSVSWGYKTRSWSLASAGYHHTGSASYRNG